MAANTDKIVIGALAHVDAGKTTLAECLLYKTNAIRKAGRVDHKDAFLDFNKLEKDKGITIYNKEARFEYKGREYIYIDTPGHNDFRYERNRSLRILDAAILIVSAIDRNTGDSKPLFDSITRQQIPVFIFVNKMDISYDEEDVIMDRLKEHISPNCIKVSQIGELLESGLIEDINRSLVTKEIVPVIFGSALKDINVDMLLDSLDRYLKPKAYQEVLNAYVYRIANIGRDRFAYVKVLSGTLENKTAFDADNKINEMYSVSGNNYTSIQKADQNDVVAVKGLKDCKVGTYLPSMVNELETDDSYTNILLTEGNRFTIFNKIKVLNDEMPELNIRLINDNLYINVKGELQKEIVLKTLKERFGLDTELGIEEKEEELFEEEIVEEEKDEHYTYSRMNVSDEEVKRIFNNTFNPKERILPSNQKKAKEAKETVYEPSRELLYLIDGYNLMHYDEKLDELSKTDFHDAREKIINMVCDFAGYVNAQCILVFDAYKNSDYVSRVSEHDNITLVYTKTRQTADEYIERKSKELSKEYRVIVVTSDALEQLRVFSYGAGRMSSREFFERYERLRKDNKRVEYKPNRPFSELKSLLLEEESE
ncbi:MAG: NYN domain-containing protein [Erysipelotrichaceae bacterium]|nr:NYN domain-containing protein [Erysipelotrichaceae bacterium]